MTEIRLDDDDAVATDFVELTRPSFVKLRQAWRAGGKLALNCNAGLVLFLRPKLRQCVMDFA